MADKKAQLIIEGAAPVELPILTGTVGPDVIDVRGLTATGRFTFDPGFMSTASCESKITYIDGDNGILLHRGYPIEQLAEHSDYLETAYLLLNGELPTAEQKAQFVSTVKNHTMVHEQLKTFFNGFRRDAHPMAVMCGVVGALSAFYHDSTNVDDPQQRKVAQHRMIAKMPTIAARAFKYHTGQPFVSPRNELDYASNFLRMSFAVPAEDYQVNPVLARAMDQFGERLGRFTAVGRRQSYPLSRVMTGQLSAPRTLFVGNAAQSLHPVAAQGFNLGLRDIATLAELLEAQADPGAPSLLTEYATRREGDRERVSAFTDRLVRLFSNTVPGLRGLRHLGLLFLELDTPARDAVLRQNLGFGGPVPAMARA